MPRIYLDYNATTPVDPLVAEEVKNVIKNYYGNPSSVYEEGRAARILIEDCREFVKTFLDAGNSGEIIFTSSGSESLNLAIIGAVTARMQNNPKETPHIITTSVEHPAVLNSFRFLESLGVEATYIGVDEFGGLLLDDLFSAVKENTALVSVMGANNETGTVFPLRQVVEEVKKIRNEILVHSDLVQVIGKTRFSLKDVPLDLCGFSGHKFYAMKGCGAMYVRKGTPIEPLIHGGHQERGLRPGTENIAGIVSMAKALGILKTGLDEESKRINALGGAFLDKLFYYIDGIKLNGHPVNRLKNTINVSFEGIKAETLLFNLDLYGISASAGSACNAGTLSQSHVLTAHGYETERIESAIRFSIGRWTTESDLDYAVSAIKKGVVKLRANPA